MTTKSEAKALVKEALKEFLISQTGKRYKDSIPLRGKGHPIEGSQGALRNYFKVGSIYRQDVAGSDCMVMVYESDKPIDKNTKRAGVSYAYAWQPRYLVGNEQRNYPPFSKVYKQASAGSGIVKWEKHNFVNTNISFLNAYGILWKKSHSFNFINWIDNPFSSVK
tara:strand:+ start:1765 stop:2259 length:495 start_codon:yes stop_codon:yes gene_type:complete